VQSGESEEEEVMGEGIGEQEMEELVPEWGLPLCHATNIKMTVAYQTRRVHGRDDGP